MSLVDLQMKNGNYVFVALHPLPETVFLDKQSLYSDLVDDLGEAQCNWIGMLHSNWEIDLTSFSLPGAVQHEGSFETAYLSIRELVSLTLQLGYEPVLIEQQTYWVYTVCLRVAGLGRVRLVFSFDTPHLTSECTVLATNRLDWSPRRIIAQSLQHSQTEHLVDKPNCQEAVSFNFITPSYSVA